MEKTSEKSIDFKSFFKKLSSVRELSVLLFLLVVGTIITLNAPQFLTKSNLMSMIRSLSSTAIMAIGMTMVIITSGIDLSVGTVLGLAPLTMAILVDKGVNPVMALAAGLAIGPVFGLFNGVLISKMKLPPFIATLSSMSIGRGVMYILTRGRPLTPKLPAWFKFLGQGYVGVVPVPVVTMIILTVIFAIIMKCTCFGRHIYAVGGNEHAARLSGVKADRVIIGTYVCSAVLCAIAGMLMYARITSAEANTGTGYEMDAIAATVIGGASMSGGAGSVIGAILGAVLIGTISNGIVLMGINTYAQQMVTGLVILFAVGFDMIYGKNRK